MTDSDNATSDERWIEAKIYGTTIWVSNPSFDLPHKEYEDKHKKKEDKIKKLREKLKGF